ncbi:hypothetical protein [Humidisolicoccus flavus]|uniref:hypothetical protein n=1 Tax=Humidisolicoccus flavus TaxID=3111414 RepID=UPI0032452B06
MKVDQAWQARLQDLAGALEQAHADRDQGIVDAHLANIPKQHIAAGVRLSAMQVHRIVKASTALDSESTTERAVIEG